MSANEFLPIPSSQTVSPPSSRVVGHEDRIPARMQLMRASSSEHHRLQAERRTERDSDVMRGEREDFSLTPGHRDTQFPGRTIFAERDRDPCDRVPEDLLRRPISNSSA
jgi:hypothetical protein